MRLWVKQRSGAPFEELRISPGERFACGRKIPQGESVEQAVVARRERARIGLSVSADYAEFLDHGAFALDREAPEVSFERGARTLRALLDAKRDSRAGRLRALIYGGKEPAQVQPQPLAVFDAGLNDAQQAAVSFAPVRSMVTRVCLQRNADACSRRPSR